jgi:hypothetical protein
MRPSNLAKVLVNAVTFHVGTGTNLISDFATSQDLTGFSG